MQTISANRTLRQRPRPLTRCKGGQGEQTQVRTAEPVADGFLKHRFSPLCRPASAVPEAGAVEGGFFASLERLGAYYGFEPKDVSAFAYPANVLMAHDHARRSIKTEGRYRHLSITGDDKGTVNLAVNETLDIGHTLFYIPVVPFCLWQKNKANRKTAGLLLSVFSYLFVRAGVPFYRQECSYLHYNYEVIENWIEDEREDMDIEEYTAHRWCINRAYHYGDLMGRRIHSKANLEQMAGRVAAYRPKDDFGRQALALTERVLKLWERYPDDDLYTRARIDGHANPRDDDEDDYGVLHIGEYVSFIAEAEGYLYNSIMDNINTDLNEKRVMEEPESILIFNGDTLPGEPLGYEYHLFNIICDLCTLLDQLP